MLYVLVKNEFNCENNDVVEARQKRERKKKLRRQLEQNLGKAMRIS